MKNIYFFIVWVIGAASVAWESRYRYSMFNPEKDILEPLPYRIDTVIFWTVVMAALLWAVWLILRPRSFSNSWGRALVALAFLVCSSLFFFFLKELTGDSPPTEFRVFLYWLSGLVVAAAVLFSWTGVKALSSRSRA
jgi:hypothetical protein